MGQVPRLSPRPWLQVRCFDQNVKHSHKQIYLTRIQFELVHIFIKVSKDFRSATVSTGVKTSIADHCL